MQKLSLIFHLLISFSLLGSSQALASEDVHANGNSSNGIRFGWSLKRDGLRRINIKGAKRTPLLNTSGKIKNNLPLPGGRAEYQTGQLHRSPTEAKVTINNYGEAYFTGNIPLRKATITCSPGKVEVAVSKLESVHLLNSQTGERLASSVGSSTTFTGWRSQWKAIKYANAFLYPAN